MKTLQLKGNTIKGDGATAIADMLKVNGSLSKLGIEWNNVGQWDFGIKAIADALCINTTLNELDLRNNKIGGQGGIALAEALRKNVALAKIGTVSTDVTDSVRLEMEQLGIGWRKINCRSYQTKLHFRDH